MRRQNARTFVPPLSPVRQSFASSRAARLTTIPLGPLKPIQRVRSLLSGRSAVKQNAIPDIRAARSDCAGVARGGAVTMWVTHLPGGEWSQGEPPVQPATPAEE